MDGGLSAVVDFGSGPDFDACFPGLYRHAYRVAYRLTGSTEEAEDLAQEALARAFGRWASVTTFAEPAAWVTRVTTNLAFDILRRRRLGRRAPVPSAMPGPNAEHLDLYRALAALPRRQRQVVVLRYLADQSEEATA